MTPSAQNSLFWSLPRELRNLIYANLEKEHNHCVEPRIGTCIRTGTTTTLALVNHQFKAEYEEEVWRRTRLAVTVLRPNNTSLVELVKKSGVCAKGMVSIERYHEVEVLACYTKVESMAQSLSTMNHEIAELSTVFPALRRITVLSGLNIRRLQPQQGHEEILAKAVGFVAECTAGNLDEQEPSRSVRGFTVDSGLILVGQLSSMNQTTLAHVPAPKRDLLRESSHASILYRAKAANRTDA